jgi:hypothetical protein
MAAYILDRFPAAVRAMAARCKLSFAIRPGDAIRGKPRARGVSGHGRAGYASRGRGRGNNLTPVHLAPPTTPVIDSLSIPVPCRTSSSITDSPAVPRAAAPVARRATVPAARRAEHQPQNRPHQPQAVALAAHRGSSKLVGVGVGRELA